MATFVTWRQAPLAEQFFTETSLSRLSHVPKLFLKQFRHVPQRKAHIRHGLLNTAGAAMTQDRTVCMTRCDRCLVARALSL